MPKVNHSLSVGHSLEQFFNATPLFIFSSYSEGLQILGD